MKNSSELNHIKNIHIRYYAAACEELGIKYEIRYRSRGLIITKPNGEKLLFYKASTPLNRGANNALTANKFDTNTALRLAGLPVPTQVKVKAASDIEKFYEFHKDIVVKPIDAHGGVGITVKPTPQEFEHAYASAKKHSETVIAETFVSGENYRFLVLKDKVLAVALRNPPFVIGDGKSTIQTLIEDENLEHKRIRIPIIKLNTVTERALKAQGFDFNSIPKEGEKVLARLTSNLSLGGTVQDVTEECHESYKTMAIKATEAIGLTLAGVDIIAEDLTTEGKPAYIIELNSAPGLRIHNKDAKGAGWKIANEIIKAL